MKWKLEAQFVYSCLLFINFYVDVSSDGNAVRADLNVVVSLISVLTKVQNEIWQIELLYDNNNVLLTATLQTSTFSECPNVPRHFTKFGFGYYNSSVWK